nr:hypothetical protein [Tanacetum cinerariifolium]
MTTLVIDLTIRKLDSQTIHASLPTSTATTTTITTTTTLPPPPPQAQQSTTDPILLPCIYLAEARKKHRKRSDSPRTHSGSPPHALPSPGASRALGASNSTKLPFATHQSSAWIISNTRDKPSGSSVYHLSPLEDQQINNDPANALATTYQAENSLLEKTRDMRTFMNWYCQKVRKTALTQADFEGQAYEVLKAFYPNVIHLQFQMEECHKMLTYQIEWANPEGDQVRIDISRPLPLSGPPGHVTIQTQFFFNKDLDYICDIAVEDLQLGTESYQKQLNPTKPGWDAKGFEYKHDYTIIESPRAVVFPVSNNERKIIRFNKIYKFSDGTLTNILEALDYRLKDYKVNRLNPDSRPEGSSETWNALLVVESDTYTGNPVKEILFKLNLPDHSTKVKRTSRSKNNQAFKIKKGMSMSAQMSQEQDGETPQDDDQRLLLADDLKEAQYHIQDKLRNKLKTKDQRSLHQSTRYCLKNQRLRAEHKINQKIAELKLIFSGVTSLWGRLLDIRKRLGHPMYFTVYRIL